MGNCVGGGTDARMRRRENAIARCEPWKVLVSGAVEDVDLPRSWTDGGCDLAAAAAGSRIAETDACPCPRTIPCRVCGRGQNAIADWSRTWTARGCALCMVEPSSRTGCCRGRKSMMLRGWSVLTPRLIRGRRILVATRGKACPVLNVMRNTLPPLLVEFVTPFLQLRSHGLNPGDLFDAHHLSSRSYMSAESGFRQFDDEVRGVVIDVLTKTFEHLDGGSDLSGRRRVHNQMWMPRERLRVTSWRWLCLCLGNHSARWTSSGRTGCAQGSLKPSRAAASSAASLFGASTIPPAIRGLWLSVLMGMMSAAMGFAISPREGTA